MLSNHPYRLTFAVAASLLLLVNMATAADLAPPTYQVMTRHGVNGESAKVSPSLTDLSIGGKMGLTHSISSYTSNFSNYDGQGPLGYKDKFGGGITKAIHHYDINAPYGTPSANQYATYVLRAFDDGTSVEFLINPDNTYTAYNYDKRHTLEFVNSPSFQGFLWTKPDGTEVRFAYGAASYDATPKDGASFPITPLTSIKYPNGLTITVIPKNKYSQIGDALDSVVTNTGFQLKYIYIQDTRPFTYTHVQNDSKDFVCGSQKESDPSWSLSSSWSSAMPKNIVAINNAVDYCPAKISDTYLPFNGPLSTACPNLTQTWRQSTYDWPAGMPRVMCEAATTVRVTDAAGGVTEFQHTPTTQIPETDPNNICGWDPNYRVPRITAIKHLNSLVPDVFYEYITDTVQVSPPSPPFPGVCGLGQIARLKQSSMKPVTGTDVIGCTGHHRRQYDGQYGADCSGNRAYLQIMGTNELGPDTIETWDKYIGMSNGRINSVASKIGGMTETFTYDARGNVTSITETDGKTGTSTTRWAKYPDTCTATTRKTCNQAVYIWDALGDPNNLTDVSHRTDYEYDAASGQVTRVKMPPDAHGIRPETRYTYSPKYAYVKDATGAFVQASGPIYMLTQERKCRTTQTLADGSGCTGGAKDEVVVDYDYGPAAGPNNLLLRGMAVTAASNTAGTLDTRRTCYSYDVYGNRIGETKPKGNGNACS